MVDLSRRRTAVLLSIGYAVLLVVFTLQVKSEPGQVVFNLIADFGFGYGMGYLLRGGTRRTFAVFAGALVLAGGVFLGDAAARKKVTVNAAALSAAATLAGAILTLLE
ncbi:hypothetical protein [Saccharothrix syringae]|uniref:hypothetical protein n=1 Tax=Saccharothrix syringae TaxID=103733 RepID=UPI0012FC3B3E|nr:hypothetical protein [Saccharothrix syringae]